jgi:ATP-dependent DNA helicase RecG
MTPQELQTLIASTETDRVEKTRSTQDVDKFREAICSFSNDMAGKGLPGYLLIGVDDKDPAYRLQVTDALLQQFASYRSDGQVMPLPVMNVAACAHPEGGVTLWWWKSIRTTCRRSATEAGSAFGWVRGRTSPPKPRSAC